MRMVIPPEALSPVVRKLNEILLLPLRSYKLLLALKSIRSDLGILEWEGQVGWSAWSYNASMLDSIWS